MGDIETVKVKRGDDYAIINKADFVEGQDELFHEKGEGEATDRSPGMDPSGRNPSGTYSEPTPTDVRYGNKDHTEFENNHGAFVGKSAAQLREERGLPDAPGGLAPNPAFEPAKGPEDQPAPDYAGMSVGDLRALAESRSVDLGDATKKADLVAALQAADKA